MCGQDGPNGGPGNPLYVAKTGRVVGQETHRIWPRRAEWWARTPTVCGQGGPSSRPQSSHTGRYSLQPGCPLHLLQQGELLHYRPASGFLKTRAGKPCGFLRLLVRLSDLPNVKQGNGRHTRGKWWTHSGMIDENDE